MSAIATGIVSGLIVVFLAWAAKAIFLARRLFLIQPRLFDYSDLVSARTSRTLELTVFNGGARSEEDIKVQLSPAFNYTILASNKAGLVVDAEGILKIDRLAPKQDSTVILTAEGGEFRKEHVVGITSKDTSGKIKEKLQDAQFSPGQNVAAALVLFVLFPAVGYVVGKMIETDVWPLISETARSSKKLGFSVKNTRVDLVSANAKTANQYKSAFEITGATRKGDLVTALVHLHNQSQARLQFTLISTTAASEKRDDYPGRVRYVVSDVLVFPSSEKDVEVTDLLPEDLKPQLMSIQVIIEGPGGRADVTQDVLIKSGS